MKVLDFIINNSELDFYPDENKTKNSVEDIKRRIIDDCIRIDFFKVKFDYETKRHNKKTNHRYVMATDADDAKIKFLDWIFTFNRMHPERELLNVKILSCSDEGTAKLSIR